MPARRATLLVFTLGPLAESVRRRLLPRRLSAVEVGLRRACLEAALAAGREAGCELVVSSPGRLERPPDARAIGQRGRGFGGRLAAALRDAGEGGPLVVVGADVPGLTAGEVRDALGRVAADPDTVVVGPSPDGGLYLLAAARPLAGLLAGVRWCRRDTLARLRRTLAAAGIRVELLAPLADLDRPADLERWLAAPAPPRASAWLAALRRLLAALRRPPAPPRVGRPRPAAVAVLGGRSPPLPLAA